MTSSYSGATPPRAFSSTTPLSAAHKPFFNPDFSLEKQRHRPVKVVSLPVLHFEQQRSHPDEEKGRSFRSGRGSRSSSNTSLCFGDLSIDSSATAVEGELDDGELADVWLEQKQKEAGVGGQDPFAVPSVLGDIFQEERRLDLRLETRRGVDWTGVLAEKIETASGELDLSGRGLDEVPDAIWELSAMRKMADPRLPPPALASLTRSLGRTQSGPLPFGSTSHPRANPRTFSRSLSSSLGHSSPEAVKTAVPLQLDLSKNNLTASSISHALFTLDNLKYLFLRQNQLERLPAGIGRLRGLEELSLSGNQLQYLPAEILRLDRLIKLRLHPNPFLQPPPPSTASGDGSYRTLGDLVVHFRVPSLLEACTRYLLEADAPSASPNILGYEIPTELADHLRLPFHTTLNPPNTTSSSTSRLPRRQRQRTTSTQSYLSSSTSSFSSSSATSSNSTAFDEECDEDLPFDPLANVCRSPAHQGVEKRFYRPAVERIEWVVEGCLTVEGRLARAVNTASRIVPLRHRGCGVRCLDWLEEPVEEVESEASDSAEGE